MKYLGLVLGSFDKLFQDLTQKDYKFIVSKDGFKLVQNQLAIDAKIGSNPNLLPSKFLITNCFSFPDESKLKVVWRAFVDANTEESIQYEWSTKSQEAAVILEPGLLRINIYSFNPKLVRSIQK